MAAIYASRGGIAAKLAQADLDAPGALDLSNHKGSLWEQAHGACRS